MTTVVDDAALKKYTKIMDEKYADDDSKETEADLKEYVESLEGVSRVEKIKNNKIVYYDEEGKKQKVDKEIYMEQMKAAKATEMAAQAMEKVPTALQKASAQLDGEKGTALSKAFSAEDGKNLVASDLSRIADENELKEAFAAMGTAGTDIWGDFDTFKKDYEESFSKATIAFEDAVDIMNNIGFEGDAGSLFGSMTAEVASAWAKNLNVFAAQGNDV
jgi:hypothetical protein